MLFLPQSIVGNPEDNLFHAAAQIHKIVLTYHQILVLQVSLVNGARDRALRWVGYFDPHSQ